MTMATDRLRAPGVYREDVFGVPEPGLRTGVPAFLGYAADGPVGTPSPLTLWPEFAATFGAAEPDGYLADVVRAFFENAGELCYVMRLDPAADVEAGLKAGLVALAPTDTVDLVCAPDVMRPRVGGTDPPDRTEAARMQKRMQKAVLEHCEDLGDRFAILDARPAADVTSVLEQRAGWYSASGALYYPWVRTPDTAQRAGLVPPCGHVAGLYAQTDRQSGVHRAPANRVLRHVVDLEADVTDQEQATLNPAGVNCLRALPGRGIRVWGARTLARGPEWTYVNVRRLFLTVGRWVERNLVVAAFEPNGPQLWARIGRELTAYLDSLFRQGALAGKTSAEGFFVKCDAETNTPDAQTAGMVVTQIGLAPLAPSEFIVIRIVHSDAGVTGVGPLG